VIRDQNHQMESELEQARKAQLALLPQKMPELPGLRIVSKYMPMDQIGGDFYDLFEFSDEKIGFVVGDVTGHGIPAAIISSMASGLFKTFASPNSPPSETLLKVNDMLLLHSQEDKFATVFYGLFDLKTHRLEFITAGHPEGFIIRPKTKEVFTLYIKSPLLGIFPNDIVRFQDASFQLEPGDKLFVYTDAIYEIPNDQDKQTMYGTSHLEKALQHYCDLPIEELLETIYHDALEFAKLTTFDDDITLLGMEI